MIILKYFKRFFYYFKEEKNSFLKYSALSVIAGFLELFGVALTYPFVLMLLSDYSSKNFCSPYLIGCVVIVLFLLKNAFMIFYINLQTKYTLSLDKNIKNRFMKYFLSSTYQDTYQISLAQKGKIFGLLISNTINNFILRLLNLNINFLIFVLISILLAIKFPLATMITVTCAILWIQFQNKIYKPLLSKYSKQVSETALLYNEATNDALLNTKGIKISNNEKYFYDNFQNAMSIHYEYNRKLGFLNSIPPFVIEPFIISLLFIMLTIIAFQNYLEPEKLIASFALIASAIFRLAPTVTRIQVNLNGINSAIQFVKELLDLMDKYNLKNIKDFTQNNFIELNNNIELKNVTFGYKEEQTVLDNINLSIRKGEFIGIAGASGVGKTTLVDLIAGLYRPRSGQILIDGLESDKHLKIGYIPQEFKVINSTVRENVAFGNAVIDDERVIVALKQAQLYDFVIKNYKKGIYENPFVDSIGFSQGQKQRLAIARALYSNPDVLILDEATSSLDLKTEHEICNVLNELKGQKTIIVIAHRLSTIKSADRIVFMEDGKIADIGDFEKLVATNTSFKELVKLAVCK